MLEKLYLRIKKTKSYYITKNKHLKEAKMLFSLKKVFIEIVTALNNINSNFETLNIRNQQQIECKKTCTEEHIDQLIDRFYKIFELHNIGVNEIPIVIDKKFEISLFDISNRENLLKKINNDLIEWLADFFYINIDWLLGKSNYMYSQHNFDKDIVGLGKFINNISKQHIFSIEVLKTSDLNNQVEYGSDDGQYIYPFIILQDKVGTLSIDKYILLNSYMWSYPRTRRDFKAVTYFLYHGMINYFKSRIYISGFDMRVNKYSDFRQGKCSYRNLKNQYSVTWYPDDYIEAKNQSAVAKETEEYEDLISYIEENKYSYYLATQLDYFNLNTNKNTNPEKTILNDIPIPLDQFDKERIMKGEITAICGEAGQIYRSIETEDQGIDAEIEFKDDNGKATGKRLYLQLKSGDSYIHEKKDGTQIFYIKKPRWAEYWTCHEYPVMLVIRSSDGRIEWMEISEYLKKYPDATQIEFLGEPLNKYTIREMRNKQCQ